LKKKKANLDDFFKSDGFEKMKEEKEIFAVRRYWLEKGHSNEDIRCSCKTPEQIAAEEEAARIEAARIAAEEAAARAEEERLAAIEAAKQKAAAEKKKQIDDQQKGFDNIKNIINQAHTEFIKQKNKFDTDLNVALENINKSTNELNKDEEVLNTILENVRTETSNFNKHKADLEDIKLKLSKTPWEDNDALKKVTSNNLDKILNILSSKTVDGLLKQTSKKIKDTVAEAKNKINDYGKNLGDIENLIFVQKEALNNLTIFSFKKEFEDKTHEVTKNYIEVKLNETEKLKKSNNFFVTLEAIDTYIKFLKGRLDEFKLVEATNKIEEVERKVKSIKVKQTKFNNENKKLDNKIDLEEDYLDEVREQILNYKCGLGLYTNKQLTEQRKTNPHNYINTQLEIVQKHRKRLAQEKTAGAPCESKILSCKKQNILKDEFTRCKIDDKKIAAELQDVDERQILSRSFIQKPTNSLTEADLTDQKYCPVDFTK
jgi:hypothetical protein